MNRQSFETLDLDDLEEISPASETPVTDESGPRRMPTPPRGLWSDVPPPLPVASAALPPAALPALDDELDEDLATSDAAPSERLDFDDLLEDLSSRPAPKASSSEWELSVGALPRTAPLPAPAPSPARRGRWALAGAAVAIAAYALGIGTMSLLDREGRVEEPTGDRAAASDPAASDPAASEPVPRDPVPSDPVALDPVPSDPVALDPAPLAAPAQSVEQRAPVARAEAIAPRRGRSPLRPAAPESEQAPAAEDAPAVEDAPVVESAAQATPAAEDASDLPESPAREDVLGAMASAQPAIEACATEADRGQLARVRFSFASDGRPVHTNVQGVSGATASCIATASRRVRVPAFSRDRFVIEFPFQL